MAGVFPTASSPTATTPPVVSPPPGVGTFPSIALSNEFVKVRWFEQNVAKAVNQRWIGMPRGVYLGFDPETVPGSRLVTLATDAQQSFSLLKVPSRDETVMVDIFTGEDVVLDFTAHNAWPVYVLATSSYKTGSPTQGKIFTRASTASAIDEIVICRVDKVGDDLVIDVTEPTNRQQPVAFQTQPYGYMPDGSIEDLSTTNAIVSEVVAARSSIYTGPHGDLKTRLDADMGGAEMADRLGFRLAHLLSNVHQNRSGTALNVSGSFTETGRTTAPLLTISSGGGESVEGAITDGVRGVCFLVNSTTKQRIINETTREPIYGQLAFSTAIIGAGKEVHFVNASVSVNGNGTNPFGAPLVEGDIIAGPDGLFYEISSIADPDNATLGAAYRGVDDFISNPAFRRWQIFLFTVSSGVFNLVTPTNVQFIFPSFFRLDRAIFDGSLHIKQDGERPQLPVATSASAGKALLATDGGLVGSFRTIKDTGTSIGADIHTLNFLTGGAANAGAGVAIVSVPGAKGAPGPSSNQGPDGPTGAAGFGYSLQNSFETGPESGDTSTAVGPVTVSYTHDWTVPSSTPTLSAQSPRSYAHVSGGWSIINGFHGGGFERIHIDSLADDGANNTRIIYRIQPDGNLSNTTIQCYMGASQ